MAWTTLNFTVGQILTAAQMNNLYANFASMAANETNAPDITSITAVTIGTATITTCDATNIQDNEDVGSFALLRSSSDNVTFTSGDTYGGSSLRTTGYRASTATTGLIWDNGGDFIGTGTWRALGSVAGSSGYYSATLFVRIS